MPRTLHTSLAFFILTPLLHPIKDKTPMMALFHTVFYKPAKFGVHAMEHELGAFYDITISTKFFRKSSYIPTQAFHKPCFYAEYGDV